MNGCQRLQTIRTCSTINSRPKNVKSLHGEAILITRSKLLYFVFFLLLIPGLRSGEAQTFQEREDLWVVVKDLQGNRLEGYLRLDTNELTVSTKDNQEKSVPLKLIESIKLEKIRSGIPGAGESGEKSYYSIRMQNSQEIFTLKKKYTFNLNTSFGFVTKTVDPDMLQNFSPTPSSPAAKPQREQPFVRDKSLVLSLEIKF